MPFKEDYLSGERITSETYTNRDRRIERIRRVYNSAGIIVRQGTRLTDQAAGELWKTVFRRFRKCFLQFPSTCGEYDAFLLEQIGGLADLLRKLDLLQRGQLGDFGIAQKMSNLFIKDHWALGTFPTEIELVLHIPLDPATPSQAQTAACNLAFMDEGSDTPETSRDYLNVQDRFRSECERVRIFQSPIEMAQFIGYRTP
jgi:hypothetical protein